MKKSRKSKILTNNFLRTKITGIYQLKHQVNKLEKCRVPFKSQVDKLVIKKCHKLLHNYKLKTLICWLQIKILQSKNKLKIFIPNKETQIKNNT